MSAQRLLPYLAAALLLPVFAGCGGEPAVDCSRFVIMDPDRAAELGADAYDLAVDSGRACRDRAVNAAVRGVGARLVAATSLPRRDNWQFAVVERPEANAFALPGERVVVYTGMLKLLASEADLAAVLGHAIGHVVARHDAWRMSRGALPVLAAELHAKGAKSAARIDEEMMLLACSGAAFGYVAPFDAEQEYAADRMGLLYMAQAGYDPREAVAFWQRLSATAAAADAATQPVYLRAHPLTNERLARLKESLPAALVLYQSAPSRLGLGRPLPKP